MWSTIVTLNPVVSAGTVVMVVIKLKSNYMFIKYHNPTERRFQFGHTDRTNGQHTMY